MKKRLTALLFLVLLLTACTAVPEAGTEQTYTLPTLKPGDGAEPIPSDLPGLPEEEALPELDARNYGVPRILGPAGSVYAIRFQGNMARDPVYGDLDGDGRKELIYRTPGSTSGGTYEVLTAYGLEGGWPIKKGEAFFALNGGETGLTADGDRVFYSYRGSGQEAARLLVTLEGDRLWVDGGGELPEGLEFLSNRAILYGVSWRQIKQKVGGRILAGTNEYLFWKEPGVLYTETELEEEEGLQALDIAVVSGDGATVTGLVYWYRNQEGERVCDARAGTAAPQVEDPEALLGLTEEALIKQLGDPWFELLRTENFAALCWFTSEGRLLTVQLEDKAVNATLTDLPVE